MNEKIRMGFFIDYLSIMGTYICGTYYALKFVQKRKNAKVYKEQLR